MVIKSAIKLYVLDTNVLIHDPSALFSFEEHQVVIPMLVLEELDKLKVGQKAIAADCREAIRTIDRIIGNADPATIATGVDRKSTRLNSSHVRISYAVFCLKKKKKTRTDRLSACVDS